MKKLTLCLSLSLLLAGTASADIVHLKSGGKMEGRVTPTEEGVLVEGPICAVEIQQDKISSIEETESPFEDYLERVEAFTEATTPEDHLELAEWCRENGLDRQADKQIRKALYKDPNHEAAHLAAGHELYEGKWMSPDEVKWAQGFRKYKGKWIPEDEYAAIADYERIQTGYTKLQKQINRMSKRSEKIRDRAHTEAVEIVDEFELDPKVKAWLDEARDAYDEYWTNVIEIESRRVIVETRASMGRLAQMRELDVVIGNGIQAKIELPVMEYTGYKGTVIVPAGGGSVGR